MSLLSVRDLAKRYGAVVALRSADLTVHAGEIHALLGANGAGKSTMVRVLTGVTRPDSGTIALNESQVRFQSPAAAQGAGIAAVFQDPALLPDLTIYENLRLTNVPAGSVQEWLQTMDLGDIDFGEMVSDLPLPMLRMLDLARALAREPQLLMLDEITAALPSDFAERVFLVMRRWRERGRSVLFISHRLKEVRAICDRATVLRDGRDVGTLIPSESGEAPMVDLMLGPAAKAVPEQPEGRSGVEVVEVQAAGEAELPLLEVRDIQVGEDVNGVSFVVRPGEIVGVAALEGQGQDELFEALSGRRKRDDGTMLVNGKPLTPRSPYDAIRAGVVLVPADRVEALLPQRSVRENIAVPLYNRVLEWGPISIRGEARRVGDAIRRLQIDTRAQRQVRRLSGGNQQKVTIARWLAAGFQVLLLFDPTRGIDVGTKRQIHTLLRQLAADGVGILFFTSELPEIQLVCDRVLVLYEGKLVSEMAASEANEGALLHAAHGLRSEEGVA
ncbi:MAG: sugar ABC transporter ATP-binding protein [Chloroflexota bacterium]|nr:MAG: sugar ABC transporter ATP-binding protein [Chloroflexota bacterium]